MHFLLHTLFYCRYGFKSVSLLCCFFSSRQIFISDVVWLLWCCIFGSANVSFWWTTNVYLCTVVCSGWALLGLMGQDQFTWTLHFLSWHSLDLLVCSRITGHLFKVIKWSSLHCIWKADCQAHRIFTRFSQDSHTIFSLLFSGKRQPLSFCCRAPLRLVGNFIQTPQFALLVEKDFTSWQQLKAMGSKNRPN